MSIISCLYRISFKETHVFKDKCNEKLGQVSGMQLKKNMSRSLGNEDLKF